MSAMPIVKLQKRVLVTESLKVMLYTYALAVATPLKRLNFNVI